MKQNIAITIDGPAGAGKTTAAKALAAALPGFRYVDTGAFYRMIACHRASCDGPDWPAGAESAMKAVPGENGSQIMMLLRNGSWKPIPDEELRSPETSERSSVLSADPAIRAMANRMIRRYADGLDVVMEGRDTGTAVMPDADVKFYLSADPAARAGRRYLDQQAAGSGKTMEETRADLDRRDYRDSHREADPLRPAEGAIMIDNTELDAAGTVQAMKDAVKSALMARGAGIS